MKYFFLFSFLFFSLGSSTSALTYPTATPIGETPGGTYRTYFDNIFQDYGSDCLDTGRVIGGFDSVGVPFCVTPVSSGLFLSGQLAGDTIRFDGANWVRNNLIYNNGSAIGIANQSPGYLLDVSGTANFLGMRIPTGAASGYVLTSDASGLARWTNTPNITASGIVGGTQNYMPKWGLGGSGLVLSQFFDNGTAVGLGTTSPSAGSKLDISGGDLFVQGVRIGRGGGVALANTVIGGSPLINNVTSINNIIFGNNSASTLTAGAGGNILIGNSINTTSNISSNELNIGNWIYGSGGNIGIGLPNAGIARLLVNGQIRIMGGNPVSGRFLTTDSSGLASWADVTATNVTATGITGGTDSYIPKFGSGGNGLYASLLYETGGRISIGNTNPTATLDISGNIRIRNGAGSGLALVSDATGLASWQTVSASTVSASGVINGTQGYIPYFGNGGNGLISSPFFITGSSVGLGMINPTATMSVSGTILSTGNATFGSVNSSGAGNFGSLSAPIANFTTLSTSGVGNFGSIVSTGNGAFGSVNSTGTGSFGNIVSTGTGIFGSVSTTGVGNFGSIVSSGNGAFGSVSSTGTGTFGSVSSTGTGTFGNIASGNGIFSGSVSSTVYCIGSTCITNWDQAGYWRSYGSGIYYGSGGVAIGATAATPGYSLDVAGGNTLIRGDIVVQGRVITDTIVNRTVNNVSISGSLLPGASAPLIYRDIGSPSQRWNNLYLSGQIAIGGGSPGLGKILISDATGLASWSLGFSGSTTASGIVGGVENYVSKFGTGGTGIYASQIFDNGTNIGVGTGANLTTKFTIDSGIDDDSGLRLARVDPNSPLTANGVVALGINASGKVLPISPISNIAVYDGVLRTTPLNPNPDLNSFNITYNFNQYFAIPGKQSFVVSQGNGPSYNGPYFKENGVSSLCSINGAYGTSPYDCNDNDPATGLSASPWNSFTMTAKGDVFGYQLALGARGDAPLFARSGRFNGSQTGGLYTNDSPFQTPAPWQRVISVPANRPEYLYINTGLNSQLQAQAGAGRVAIGTTTPQSRFEVWSGATSVSMLHFRGVDSVAMGLSALDVGATGQRNSAFGAYALDGMTSGGGNVGIGFQAGNNITTGSNNIMIGSGAIAQSSTASDQINIGNLIYATSQNVGLGVAFPTSRFEIWSGTTVSSSMMHFRGSNNLGIGLGAVRSNQTGNANVGIGNESLFALTSGYSNTALGYRTLRFTTTGFNNTSVGQEALYSNAGGSWNTALGYQALYSNSNGSNNIAIGPQALNSNSVGSNNISLGYQSLRGVAGSSVSNVVAIGHQALFSSSAGDLTAVGYQALYSNTSGTGNTALGYQSLDMVTSGSNNTAVGYNTLSSTTGNRNTVLGAGAGSSLTTGSNNLLIGEGVQAISNTASNQLNIGNWIYGSGGNIGIGTSTGTMALTVAGQIQITGGSPGLGRVLTSDANGIASWTNLTGSALSSWSLVGNAGTSPGSNFVGTTDAQDLALRTNNLERIRIGSGGNIGIGTSTPASRMSISGGGLSIGYPTIVTPTDGSIIAGNVGIGMSAPTERLTVNGTINTPSDNSAIVSGNDQAFGFVKKVGFLSTLATNNANPILFSKLSTATITSANVTAGTLTELMRIDNNGNVGIGTSTPTTRLDINGQIRIQGGNPGAGRILVSDATGLASWQLAATGSFAGWSLIGNAGTDPLTNFVGTTDNQPLVLRTNSVERMRLLTNGNVGIGTNNPGERLDISGNVRISQGNFLKFPHSGESNTDDGKIGVALFAPGLNIIGSRTDATSRKINIWGGITQTENNNGNTFIGNTNFPGGIWNSAGNLGVGTASPGARLDVNGQVRITGGIPGAGKVLTSDAAGLATWEVVSATLAGGQANYLTRWLTATTVGTGSIIDNGAGILTIPAANSRINANQGFMIEQTGDTSGTTRLSLQNRAAQNGLMLEQAGSVNFIDLIMKGTTNQRVIRYESRGGASNFAGTPEFQIGTAGNPALAISDNNTVLRTGNLGIGTTVAPTAKLEVNGQVKITGGNVGSGKVLVSDATGLGTWMTFGSQSGTFIYRMSTNQSTTSTTPATLTSLSSVSLPVGPYEFQAYVRYQSAQATAGLGIGLASTTAVVNEFISSSSIQDSNSTRYEGFSANPGTMMIATSTPTANATTYAKVEGTFNVTTPGSVALQFVTEVGGTQITIEPGTVLIIKSVNPALLGGGFGI